MGVNKPSVLFAACLACALAAAPRAPQQPPPRFRTGVNLVVVDVSVLDEQRMPVRGLTAADFTILEEGRPQPITAFDEIDVPDVETPTAAWMRDVAPDVQCNVDQRNRRLLIIVLDDATPMPARDVPRVREMARRVVDRLGPADLAAVVYVLNKKKGQEFTSNRSRLLAALDHFNGGLGAWDAFSPSALTMYQATLGTLQGVIESLIDLPDRRKAVVFVSVGLPVDSEAVGPSAAMGGGNVHALGAAQDVITQTFDVFRAAQRANVNIYGLDPGGLRAGDVGRLNREFLQALSENTGGLAIVETNDPEPGIVQMFRENGSYYLLGYEAPNPQSQGRYRRIDIRVNRPGVTVRSRRGYLEPREAASRKPGTKSTEAPSPVLGAIASVVPKTDIALRATAAPFAVPGQRKVALAVVLQVEVGVAPSGEPRVDNVAVQVNAYNTRGRVAGSDAAKGRIPMNPGAEGNRKYEALLRLDLDPGTYHLRLGASTSLQAKSGSVYYDVDVPDFSKGPLAVSGAVISATPGVSSAPKDRLAALLPVVPTTEREFSSGQAVTVFLRVYQPGQKPLVSVLMRARIVDSQSAEVFTNAERLDPDRFGSTRSADFALTLPVRTLPDGGYLLTIEAAPAPASTQGRRTAAGRLIRRDVRFAVR